MRSEAESRARGLWDQERQGLVGGLGMPGLEEWWDEWRLPGSSVGRAPFLSLYGT